MHREGRSHDTLAGIARLDGVTMDRDKVGFEAKELTKIVDEKSAKGLPRPELSSRQSEVYPSLVCLRFRNIEQLSTS